jgi:hypothetical protein
VKAVNPKYTRTATSTVNIIQQVVGFEISHNATQVT